MKPEFSVVLTRSATSPPIDRLLGCIEGQTVGPERIECVVVPTFPLNVGEEGRLRDSPLAIAVVPSRPSLGRFDALDRGASQARGAIIVFCDDDLLPSVTWLADFNAAFAKTAADVVSAVDFGADVAVGLRALCALQSQPVGCAYAFSTSNVAVRKSILDRTSGFNPCLRALGEVDLGIRLWEMGGRFGFVEDAAASREGGSRKGASPPNHDDVVTLFWRHPYSWVLLMAAWMRDRDTGAGGLEGRSLPELLSAQDDLDPLTEYHRSFGRPAARLDTWMTGDRLAEYISAFQRIPVAEIHGYLKDARTRGVLCRREGSDIAFDASLVHNWIQDCHLMFQQNHLEECLVDERRRTPFIRSGDPRNRLELRCRARYEVTVEAAALGHREGILHIPLPISHALQTDLEIVDCQPPMLWNHVNRAKGMILDIPVASTSAERVSYSYEFTCRLHEAPSREPIARGEAPGSDHERPGTHAFPPNHLARAKLLLEELGVDGQADAFGAARAIYRWLQDNVVFMLRPAQFPFYRVLDAGYGDCIAQILLFVNLCQLAGVPARYQCGTRFHDFEPERAHNQLRASRPGSSPLCHTWAEFHVADRGWVPVELQGHGIRRINAANVESPVMRDTIRDAMRLFERERFGQLPPCRIYASPSAIRRPTFAVLSVGENEVASKLLEQETVHTLTCDFSRSAFET